MLKSLRAHSGRSRGRAAGLFALVWVVVLCPTACSADPSSPATAPSTLVPAPTRDSSAEASELPQPVDPSIVDIVTIDLRLGSDGSTRSLSSTTTAKPLDEATTRLVTKVPILDETVTLRYTVLVPESATVTALTDGAVAISDEGALLIGFAAPRSSFTDVNLGDTHSPWKDITPRRGAVAEGWTIAEQDPGRFVLSQEIAAAASKSKSSEELKKPRKAAAVYGMSLIAGTQWAQLEGGKSLMVSATILGRIIAEANVDLLHAELVHDVPQASTDVMAKQLRCHADYAPAKATWNLEPWRPDVSYLKYLLAGCNPIAE